MATLRGVAVLVILLSAAVFCNAGPVNSKVPPKTDLATYVGVATGLSQVPKVKILADPIGSLQMSSDGDSTSFTVPKDTNITLTCSVTFWVSQRVHKKRHKGKKDMRHIGRHNLGWAFPGAENQHKEVLRYYPHGHRTTVESVLQINNVHENDSGNYVCYCEAQRGQWDGLNAFYIDVEPPQPKVHVYAVPKFSMKPHSRGENRHYIFKEGSNITLTCETSFNKTNKNILINWVHPKAENQYEVKQIHSHHEGMNIKERILHIKDARAEDSGTYICHTRSLHQKTWVSPNIFYIQVGEETKVKNYDLIQKLNKHNPKAVVLKLSTTKTTTIGIATGTKAQTTTSSPSTTKTSPAAVVTTTTTHITSTTTSTTLPTTTQGPIPAASKFNAVSFLGGMGLVAGVLLLLILIQVIIKKRRQQSYGYLNM